MIGICTFLSTIEVVDPLNILSRMVFGKYMNFSLFVIANASCTKLWEDPESKSAWNGWCGFQVEGEERERKNEFGQREVAFSQRDVLLVFLATHPEHWLKRVTYSFSWSSFSGGVDINGSICSFFSHQGCCSSFCAYWTICCFVAILSADQAEVVVLAMLLFLQFKLTPFFWAPFTGSYQCLGGMGWTRSHC